VRPASTGCTGGAGGIGVATVVIVDDDRLVWEHLQERLGREEDLDCIGVAAAADAARELVLKTQPDLIVLDIMLDEATDPIDLAGQMVRLSPRSRVVVCTAWSDSVRMDSDGEFRQKVRASRSGVVGWISKSRGIREIVAELRVIALWCAKPEGPSQLDRALGDYLRVAGSAYPGDPFHADQGDAGLTPTEARIAAMVARGLEADMTIDEIANSTRLVPGTVRAHMKTIYTKWGVRHQAAFVAEARRRGLLGV
jgi:DNA-binding NarL/FixJ family response regulator